MKFFPLKMKKKQNFGRISKIRFSEKKVFVVFFLEKQVIIQNLIDSTGELKELVKMVNFLNDRKIYLKR